MGAGQRGALQGAAQDQRGSTAVVFNGTANGYTGDGAPETRFANPQTFSIETWFRTTSTGGGHLVGFDTGPTGLNGQRDRTVYLDNAGRVAFYTYVNGQRSIRSTGAYNDGNWHHVVATLGSAGMFLYVDGVLVDSRTDWTGAEPYDGWWRWGGGNMASYPNAPADDYFVGTLDEVAVYPTQLTRQQVLHHYYSNH